MHEINYPSHSRAKKRTFYLEGDEAQRKSTAALTLSARNKLPKKIIFEQPFKPRTALTTRKGLTRKKGPFYGRKSIPRIQTTKNRFGTLIENIPLRQLIPNHLHATVMQLVVFPSRKRISIREASSLTLCITIGRTWQNNNRLDILEKRRIEYDVFDEAYFLKP